MEISLTPHSDVLAIQGQSGQPGNTKQQSMTHTQDVHVARLNRKANLTCCKCGEWGHTGLHAGSSAVTQKKV